MLTKKKKNQMIHKQKIHVPSKEVVVEHNIASCIICANDDISIDEYEDKYGFISTATCKKCGNNVRENVSEGHIIKTWNNQNDIQTVIQNKTKLIISLNEEIKMLKKEQRKRLKKQHE